METPVNVTIALDNTPTDKFLISFVSYLSKVIQLGKINFVHAAEEKPEYTNQIDDNIKKLLDASLQQKAQLHILTGDVLHSLIRFLKDENQDLLIIGKKKGKLDNKLINKSPVSTILVPEDALQSFNKIIVPVDFSVRSSHAANTALQIKAKNQTQLDLLYVYCVLPGYTKIGKTYQEAAANALRNANEDALEFLQKNNFKREDFNLHFILDDDTSPADRIYAHAKSTGTNLIIIGSKGRTDTANILMGSIAEKVSQLDADIPLWVVKEKGETLDFFEALFQL